MRVFTVRHVTISIRPRILDLGVKETVTAAHSASHREFISVSLVY